MLEPNNPLWAILAYATAGLTAALIARYLPYYRKLVQSSVGRLAPLDGLRGFLAFGVFIHHSRITYGLVTANTWVVPPDQLYAYLGRGCVSLFFMVSGFLFWSRAIDKRIEPERLLVSRFWRIMPLYWATTTVIFITAGWLTHWKLQVDSVSFVREVAFWLAGGYFSIWTINGLPSILCGGGVAWSLLYEWWFYLALPLMAILAPVRRFAVALVVFFVLRRIAPTYFPEYAGGLDQSTGFALGMLAAYLVRIERLRLLMRSSVVAFFAVATITGALIYNQRFTLSPISYEYISFPLFLAVVCGNTIWRVLTRPWALLLGHASFSIYLTHMIVICFLVQRASGYPVLQQIPALRYWGKIIGFVSPVVVVVSVLAYRFVEAPFLARASMSSKKVTRAAASLAG